MREVIEQFEHAIVSNKDFSLFIPSRGRVKKLERVFETIMDSTAQKHRIEVLVALDNDDVIVDYLAMLEQFNRDINIKIVIRNQDPNWTQGYVNLMARMSIGKYLWILNDDCEIGTIGWDEIIRNNMGDKYKEVWLLNIGGTGVSDFSAFPMITRPAYRALGYFFFPYIFCWWGDEVLWNAFMLANRVVEMKHKVYVVHDVFHKGDLNDKTWKTMEENSLKGMHGKDFQYYQQVGELIKRGVAGEFLDNTLWGYTNEKPLPGSD